jgi:hypothetical protein
MVNVLVRAFTRFRDYHRLLVSNEVVNNRPCGMERPGADTVDVDNGVADLTCTRRCTVKSKPACSRGQRASPFRADSDRRLAGQVCGHLARP